MQCFRGPAAFHEVARQPVQKFRMRRSIALTAEVFGRGHKASTEVPPPHAIHVDACRERMLGTGHPPGKFQPAALIVRQDRPRI